MVIMTDRDENNSPQRCACKRGTSLGVLSAGRLLVGSTVGAVWVKKDRHRLQEF